MPEMLALSRPLKHCEVYMHQVTESLGGSGQVIIVRTTWFNEDGTIVIRNGSPDFCYWVVDVAHSIVLATFDSIRDAHGFAAKSGRNIIESSPKLPFLSSLWTSNMSVLPQGVKLYIGKAEVVDINARMWVDQLSNPYVTWRQTGSGANIEVNVASAYPKFDMLPGVNVGAQAAPTPPRSSSSGWRPG